MVQRPLRLGALALVLAGCSLGASDAPVRPATAAPAVDVSGIATSVAHRDPRLGVPSFVWLHGDARAKADGSAASEVAKAVLPVALRALQVKPEAHGSVVLDRVDEHGRGPIVARFRQEAAGIPVFRGGVSMMLSRALEPVAATGFVAPTLRGTDRAFALEGDAALDVALRVHGVAARPASTTTTEGDYRLYDVPGLSQPARVRRVWFPIRDEAVNGITLEPGYYVEIMSKRGASRSYVISAADGRVLFSNDLSRADAYTYRVWADPTTKIPYDGPQGNGYAPHPTGKPDHQQLALLPSQLVSIENFPFSKNDPWLPPGATTTTGNNVDAYADIASPDGFSAGDVRTALTAPSTFGDVYDTSQAAGANETQIRAATTHLFYLTNYLHDWFYDSGFDEKAGNHQTSNFGRGGQEGDPLRAEAQDNSGKNNANAQVPADGASPILQMYVFSGASQAELDVTAPSNIAGTKTAGIAGSFGPDAFDLTGSVVLAADGQGDLADACEPLEGDVTGKIVLVHRGTCGFAAKATAVQTAGGIGVIVANTATSTDPQTAPAMGGPPVSGVTVPSLSLNLADGQALESAIPSGVTVRMKRSVAIDLDGGIDSTIAAHEWGHVLSGRLVHDGNGLNTNQSGGLGEGWADFTALLLEARVDDPGNFGGTYANGAYAMSAVGPDIYFGTRRVPYSIDFTKNPLTLKHMSNGTPLPSGVAPISFGEDGASNSEVHNTGEIWATMLWECYAALLRDGRFTFPEAQERMKRYLVASLELTPADPTILEARDAVLAAALANDDKDFTLFFEAFARRGAGAGAEGPPKDSSNNVGVKESFSAGRAASILKPTLNDDVVTCDKDGILDPGEVGSLKLTVKNTGSATLTAPMLRATVATPGVTLVQEVVAALDPLPPFATKDVSAHVKLRGGTPAQVVELDAFVTDPDLPGGQSEPTKLQVRVAADEVDAVSSSDDMETASTSWRIDSQGAFGQVRWARVDDAGNHYWFIADEPVPSDQRLTSPVFTVEGGALTISFRHKYAFRHSTRRQVDQDGGVLEISIDGGATWKDASEYGNVGYPTTLDGVRTDNPLHGRPAFGNQSTGYPDAWTDARVDLTLPEGALDVKFRFRAASGQGFAGAPGWSIDDVKVEGASTTPFFGFVPHEDLCDENGPRVTTSGPSRVRELTPVKLVGVGTHPQNLQLAFEWTQVEGPAVSPASMTTSTLAFEAPDVKVLTPLTFELRANDGALLSPASRVTVQVAPATYQAGGGCNTTPSRGAGETGGAALLALGTLALARRRRSR